MRAWGRLPSQNGAVLFRQFAVLSFVIVALITTPLCVVISHYLKADLLEREWTTTADFIRNEDAEIGRVAPRVAPAAGTVGHGAGRAEPARGDRARPVRA